MSASEYATPPSAIRVFQGYRYPNLSPEQFLAELGNTFMPGTAYMLAPLGCAAYLPGVIAPEDPLLPNEFALIVYPSTAVWEYASRTSLRGRVYTQTHSGVYDTSRSHAAFPVSIARFQPVAPQPFWLFDAWVDWQSGSTVVVIAKKPPAQSSADFNLGLRDRLLSQSSQARATGVDQVIVLTDDAFAIAWIHVGAPADRVEQTAPGEALFDRAEIFTTVPVQRVICRSEPPTLTLTATSAFNYIFVRAAAMFLR